MEKSVVQRASKSERKIIREISNHRVREENEIQSAYNQIGETPNRSTKSWYRDIYDFYQNNEV